MTNYNPYSKAFQALTSDRAIAFYFVRAQADTQMVVDSALTVGIGIYHLCSFVYALGVMAGEAHYSKPSNIATAPIQSCLLRPKVIASLPPAKVEPKPHIITPAPKPDYRVTLMLLSRNALRSACRDRHISYSGKDRKADLVEKLIENGRHLGAIQSYRIRHRSGRWVSIA